MSGKQSRDKGARGEREVLGLLGKGFKRTGYAGISAPDLSSSWATVSCKNTATPISLKRALKELITLERQEPKLEHYVTVKVNHTWLIIERLEQFREDRC